MRSHLAPVIAFALVFAGCLQGGTSSSSRPAGLDPSDLVVFDPDWAEKALPFGSGHDHFNATQHQGVSTPNFELLGWNPLVSQHYGQTAGGHLCGDATDAGDKRYAAVQGAGDVAFVLVDVTNASDPQVVGEFILPTASTRDVAITPDGKFVVLGQSSAHAPERGTVPPVDDAAYWRSACTPEPVPVPVRGTAGPEQNLPWASGALLINIQNPRMPSIDSYFPLPALGAHSIYATQVKGQYFVLASVVNLVAAITYFQLFDIQTVPGAGAELVHLSYILENPTASNMPLINGHNDGVIQVHPITGRTLAYLAHWHQGLVIADLTNPRLPQVIGRWSDNPPGNVDLGRNDHGDIHEALPIDTVWNGKHYTFIGQEILGHPTQRPSGYVKAIDTTDPGRLKEAAHWNLPVDVQWGASLQFSPHYLTRVDRTVFVSHYHAGVWAIDASNIENDTQMPSVGAFLPAHVSPHPPPRRGYSWTPTIMDAIALKNGDLVVYDSSSGAYIIHFDASQPAPPAPPLKI